MPSVRKLIDVPWKGTTYQAVPGPALINAIEARPDGIPIREIVSSIRITDHSWVIFCALRPFVPGLDRDEVTDAVMEQPQLYEDLSLTLCLETLYPEAARKAVREQQEEAGQEGNGASLPGTSTEG